MRAIAHTSLRMPSLRFRPRDAAQEPQAGDQNFGGRGVEGYGGVRRAEDGDRWK